MTGFITRGLLGVAVLAVAASGPLLAAPAHAAVPGLEVVTAHSVTNSASTKTVTATCPAGTKVTGTAGYVTNGAGEVRVTKQVPSTSSVTVAAAEDDTGKAGSWGLTAIAYCAKPLPGLRIVPATSTGGSATTRTVTAACPAGDRLVGTGYEVGSGQGQVGVDVLFPSQFSAKVSAVEDGSGYTGNWTLTSYAVCADPLPGYNIATQSTAPVSSPAASAAAKCLPGTKVIGTGARVTGGEGQVLIESIYGTQSQVNMVAAEDEDGFPGNWFVIAWAICATP